MLGAAAMSLSSVCVVTNSLRIKSFRARGGQENNKIKGERTMKIFIDGMTCPHCKARVEQALVAVAGVRSAEVDLAEKCATVVLSSDVPAAALTAAVTAAGYDVRGVEE